MDLPECAPAAKAPIGAGHEEETARKKVNAMANGCTLAYNGKESSEEILRKTQPALLTEGKVIRNLNSLTAYSESKENKLIQGNNLPVLKSLFDNDSIRGKVTLVYIDPPYSTRQDFKTRDEEQAYFDRLVGAEYVEFIRKRLIFLRELLADDATIYVHLDQKMGHYIKVVMDEIFGQINFRNDITRIKCNPKNFARKAYGNIKDVIYFYSKVNVNGNSIVWNDYTHPLNNAEIKRQFPRIDSQGRRYTTTPVHAKGETKNGATGSKWNGILPPKGRHWRYAPNELTRLDEEGLIEWSSTGNPRKIIYADQANGKKIQDVWDFKDPGANKEHYPTEKNEALLERIIENSSRKGDLILDCFCGSGTTIYAAEKLGRRWIGIDESEKAIATTIGRLTSLKTCRPFAVFKAR